MRDVDIKELLDGIETAEERRERSMSESKEGKAAIYIMFHGPVGAVGPGAHAHDMQFQQIWNQVQGQIDLPVLARELEETEKEA